MRFFSVVFFLLLGSGFFRPMTPARATESAPQKLRKLLEGAPMQVGLVRSATPGCEPNCAEWIAAEGKITSETPAAFEAVFRKLGSRKAPVLVRSEGGSVDAAIAIGRMIRARGLDVTVAHTALDGCPADRDQRCVAGDTSKLRGTPVTRGFYCASACTLLFAGGVRRLVAPWSSVGVHEITEVTKQWRVRRFYRVTRRIRPNHQARMIRTLVSETTFSTKVSTSSASRAVLRRMTDYLGDMNVSRKLVPLMMATPATSVHWMTRQELRDTRLVTDQSGSVSTAPLDQGAQSRHDMTPILRLP